MNEIDTMPSVLPERDLPRPTRKLKTRGMGVWWVVGGVTLLLALVLLGAR